MRSVFTFSTVEEFWSVYNNIHHPSKLAVGADFYCFKKYIEPKWEDHVCANGGKWTIISQKGKFDTYWLYTLLAMIGEQFDYGDEICGAVVNVRGNYAGSKPTNQGSLTILGLHLTLLPFTKMSFFSDKKEVQRSATALGYVAHAVSLIASYLEVPLRYPLHLGGSHSYINDYAPSIEPPSSDSSSSILSNAKTKQVEFPLFLDGQDTTRAAYAVFLLNKSMNPTEKQALLNGARIVNAHLREATALFEHKILQTENDIQLMQARVLELTLVQDRIYAEEEGDEAVAAMEAIGGCLTDNGSALAHVEQERAHLVLALKNVSTASEYINRFENGVASIPDN